jgi:hypothetical protein
MQAIFSMYQQSGPSKIVAYFGSVLGQWSNPSTFFSWRLMTAVKYLPKEKK